MKTLHRLTFPSDITKDEHMRIKTDFYEKVLPDVLRRHEVVYYLYERAMRLRCMVGKPIPPFPRGKGLSGHSVLLRCTKQDAIRLKNYIDNIIQPMIRQMREDIENALNANRKF